MGGRRQDRGTSAVSRPARAPLAPRDGARPEVVILGGGLTGLSAAYHLRRPWLLLEKNERTGGHARTDVRDGFYFDKTGHWLHLRDPAMKQLVGELLPGRLTRVERRAKIFSHGVLTRYPFQGNLFGLPPAVIKECMLGFLRAQGVGGPPPIAEAPRNFEEFCLQKFGEGISRHFMIPYNQKLWGVHPREITAEWCSRFVPIPKLEDVVAGAVGDVPPEMGYNISFLYPKKGGIEVLPRALRAAIPEGAGRIETGVSPDAIDLARREVEVGGERVPYRALISTIPLPQLVRRLRGAPPEIEAAGARLRCTPVRYLNVAVKRPLAADFHWIYVPEEKYPFYRVGIYTNAVPAMAPRGCGSLYVELADRGPIADRRALVREVLRGLVAAKVLARVSDVLFADLEEIEYAYVVFDHEYYGATRLLHAFLESQGIYSRGRYGAWIYNAMEDSMMAGREVALRLNESLGGAAVTAAAAAGG